MAGARTCSTRLPSFRGFPTRAAGLGFSSILFWFRLISPELPDVLPKLHL